MTSPANLPTLSTRRSRENLKPNATTSSIRAQPGDFTLKRKNSYNQLESSSSTPVGILTNSSAGALAGYYHSGLTSNRLHQDSLRKDVDAVAQEDQMQMIGRSQYPELYKHQQQNLPHQLPKGVDQSIIQRANSINSSIANLPAQFQLYGSQDDLGEQV